MTIFARAVALFVYAGVTGTVLAQGSVLDDLYGQGVHDYFAGRYAAAHALLTQAVEQGSQDPRCHYFLGLASTRLGRPEEAAEEFETGARLESRGTDRVYPIGASLQRVQGLDRVELEKHRADARTAARLEATKIQRARYQRIQQAEKQVLRDPSRTPGVDVADLIGPLPAHDATDPFTGTPPVPQIAPPRPTLADVVPAAATPSTPPTESAVTTSPARTAPAPPAAPATRSEDPFAEDPFAAPAPSTAPAPPTSSPADNDPFSADPFSEDPFRQP